MSIYNAIFPTSPAPAIPLDAVQKKYTKLSVFAFAGVYIGYVAAYWIRNNFGFSTPHFVSDLHFTKTEIGMLSSCLLIAYGISKGVMSSVADKSNPKFFLALGLILSALLNVALGFTSLFWGLAFLLILNGIAQGMCVGPAFITIASWFPRSFRGRVTAVWNTSHNVGGGMVAPIAAGAMLLGFADWRVGSFFIPALMATLVAIAIIIYGVGTMYQEGLPPIQKVKANEATELVAASNEETEAARNLTPWQIFCTYVLPNKGIWYISLMDVFVYILRFGMITWLPLYLLQQKGFTKAQMAVAFFAFEFAAIPATIFSGYISDRLFKGKRMPLAIICMFFILIGLYFYWTSNDIVVVSFAAAFVGSLVFVPQFLASIQTIELVKPFAVGSAVGLRGFMSYIFGSAIGTALIGLLVDKYGWDAGFYVLVFSAFACILFSILTHLTVISLEKSKS